jgi:putative N6-adenine-specific DNA methylase
LQEFPWELFMSPGTEPALSITTRHSRLYHTDAIGGYIEESIKERLAVGAPSSEVHTLVTPVARVFVRSVDDVFTLSLDSSGEHLHKRGIKTHPAEAPIRETLAAAALMLVGYDGSRPLVDPMCGSGTFSLEAALIYRNVPPGWFRDFAFKTWPAFRSRQWVHLKKDMEKGFRPQPDRPAVWASDTDQIACATLQETVDRVGLSDTVSVSETDFFDLFPADIPGEPGIVTINPPYGHRIGTLKESNALFVEICRKLKTDYRGWGLVLIVPGKHLLDKLPFRLHCHALHHGGLKLGLLTGTID